MFSSPHQLLLPCVQLIMTWHEVMTYDSTWFIFFSTRKTFIRIYRLVSPITLGFMWLATKFHDFKFIMVTRAKCNLFSRHTFSDVYLKCSYPSICTDLLETSNIITQFSLKTFISWVSCSFLSPSIVPHGLLQSAPSSYTMQAQIQSQAS